MSSDPFNIVKEELKKTVTKTQSLINKYNNVIKGNSTDAEAQNIFSEIRISVRSINWDLQDLNETIEIASKNPNKFNLTNYEIENRKQFIEQTRQFVQKIQQNYSIDFEKTSSANLAQTDKINIRVPDLISNSTKNYKENANFDIDDESDYELDTRQPSRNQKGVNFDLSQKNEPSSRYVSVQMQHEDIFKEQDKNLDLISTRVSSLKNISQTMQNELDDQANLLDDIGREMDTADSRMQNVMKKMTKVLHLSSDKRQWTLIGILLLAIFIVIILFIILP
ncbi:syntaxin-6 isoform X1 [Brachionus plicatilis]|uniref:Syntaxin-6 isoform X1 n=1 Tax=Brachionus plicatilis TaxID=10195 RepID=A0A3M7T1Y9_BRAPC|nr:syntaxin-6 isoform X1 [Brachionus plicatilis]